MFGLRIGFKHKILEKKVDIYWPLAIMPNILLPTVFVCSPIYFRLLSIAGGYKFPYFMVFNLWIVCVCIYVSFSFLSIFRRIWSQNKRTLRYLSWTTCTCPRWRSSRFTFLSLFRLMFKISFPFFCLLTWLCFRK